MIGSETVFSALVTVVLFMVLLSLPSIYITLVHSYIQFRRCRQLRKDVEKDTTDVPPDMIPMWNAVKTDVGYIAVLTEGLEKIGTLRVALLNSEISAIIIVILMFIPGFETDVFILMSALLVLCIVALVFGYVVIKLYGQEYVSVACNISEKGEESKDNMYV